MILLAIAALLLATLPTVMTIVNVAALRVPGPAKSRKRVAILIPARDEAAAIAACLESALASVDVSLEVIVMDDNSTDATATIVERLAAADPRLRLCSAPPLPDGWTGKQHACHLLSMFTDAQYLLFIDADVRLAADAAVRLVGALADVDLVSGVPRQRMESLAEMMIIPMINALLLGYLPILLSRRDPRPALAAACGQMIAVRAASYKQAGGHAAIRSSLHDGLSLPRLFRVSGLRTDLVAGSRLADCRMYDRWSAVVNGVTKNATEGLAKPATLPVWTILLLGAHLMPWILLLMSLFGGAPLAAAVAVLACAISIIGRLIQAMQSQEPLPSVLLTPAAIALLIGLQWLALVRKCLGGSETWRGRSYRLRRV